METQTTTQTSLSLNNLAYFPTKELWTERLPKNLRNCSLEICKDLPEKLVAYGRNWAMTRPIKSLYFFGNPGCGKTTFAIGIIKDLFKNISQRHYFWPNYVTGLDLDETLLGLTRGDVNNKMFNFCESDLLFIDDLDKVVPSQRFKKQLFQIVNTRMTNDLPTIMTSNFSPLELSEIIDPAVISRLSDNIAWQILEFPKKDLRKIATVTF